jgi:glyoxylase-like metal-dependent hydrolase (beta-lactamase superfamily II)
MAAQLAAQRAFADPDPAPGSSSGSASIAPFEPVIHSFSIGSTEAYVILDGSFAPPGIQPMFAPEAKKSDVEESMKHNFLPPDKITLALNVLVLKAQSGVMLFDAGAGTLFGPSCGRLVRGLERIGVSPKDVKTICLTHAHLDHIGGLVDPSNAPLFPSARIVAAKTEVEFWTSDAPDTSGMRTPADATAQAVAGAKKILTGVKSQLDLQAAGKVSSEVEMILAPGHTPGHASFLVTSGSDKLLVIGDAVHIYALQFQHPEWTMIYDTNPKQAIETRRKVFKQAASDRTTLFAFHLPFPGIGHVRSAGANFEWVPKPWV